MRKPIKILILIVLLAVPVTLYIFLLSFGKNHYDLPIYYEQGLDSLQTACGPTAAPHRLHEGVLTDHDGQAHQLSDLIHDKISVFQLFTGPCADTCGKVMNQMLRVSDEFKGKDLIQFLSVTQNTNKALLGIRKRLMEEEHLNGSWQFYTLPAEGFYELAKCGLVLPVTKNNMNTGWQIVLVDRTGRIRGYYDGYDLKDMDRLMVEIKVLLSQL